MPPEFQAFSYCASILQCFFANSTYLKDRILRWIEEEEETLAKLNQHTLRYVVLDMGSVTSIDTSGINTLHELKKILEQRQLQLVLANPGRQEIEKLHKSKFMDALGHKALFPTVEEAIVVCSALLHPDRVNDTNCTKNTERTCTTKEEYAQ